MIASIVAGVFGMPAAPPVSASDALAPPVAAVASPTLPGAGVPEPFIGPDPVGGGSSLDSIARLDGVALLDRLASLPRAELGEFESRHPDALAELAASPPLASSVAQWWDRTPAAAQAALTVGLPAVVGNLDGLPYGVRDRANRAFLAATEAALHRDLDRGVGRAMEEELRTRLGMLDAIDTSLRTGESGQRRYLVALDVAGEGRAVIAIGDPSRADYVTYFVPGMYVGVAAQLVDWTGNAETSLLEQRAWLDRLGGDGEVATVAWIGYQTPTLVNISSLDLAYQGRDALTWSLQGLEAVRETRATGTPYLSIVAHSYGSTAAMLALEENDVEVDALVLVGSPGSPASSVADLKVRGGNVWVGAADTDPIPRSGVFGSQPLDPDFGAQRFSVRGQLDPVTGQLLEDITGHVYYFWPGTTAVRNTALIALGEGALVTTDGADGGSGELVARARER